MDPLTILAAFAPLVVDAGKSVIGKFIGSDFKPASISEWLTMENATLARYKAINEAGGANPSYPWVEAVIRLQRPAVAVVALGTWCYSRTWGTASPEVDNFAAVIGFYLFGDRTLFYAKQK